MEDIETLIKSHVQDAKILRTVGNLIDSSLPLESISNFSSLFKSLDNEKERLGIESYSISLTTLEEVFLRLSELKKGENIKRNIFKMILFYRFKFKIQIKYYRDY